ncbi:MAG: hypothetical protein H0U67_05300 [Gemmatimonadetes bacterium]|nr:hypothetical protein [Gemmatimonadota bacterium]
MARAQYSMSGPVDGVLTCSMSVRLPDGPTTPDTAFFSHAFVVTKAHVSAVRIIGGV